MKRVDIKVGFKCNNQCRFCVQGDKRKIYADKSTQEVKDILREARGECDGVVFTGGEPTIRKDILDLVKYASNLRFKVIQMQTNGRMFCYGKFCDEIIKAGATEFSPAVHGHRADLHDYLTDSAGSFDQTISGIKNLKARNQMVITNTVVTKSNYRHLPEIAGLLVDLGVDQFQFAFVHALGRAKNNFASIVPRMALIEPYLKKGLDIGIRAGVKAMTEALPYCIMKGYEDCVAEKIIPRTKIYDVRGVIDDFTEARKKEGKSRGPLCAACSYYGICEGTWKEYPQNFGWDEFHPLKNKKRENQDKVLKAVEDTFGLLIKRNKLGVHARKIHRIRKILFSDFEPAWLSENQKFDFSFSGEGSKPGGLRFSYNNFGEKITFERKYREVFSMFNGVYATEKFKEVLDFMKSTNEKHQTTIGFEWLARQRYPRFKIYFEELFHSYTKKELILKLKGICRILGFDFGSLGLRHADTIGAIAVDFLSGKLVNLKVYLLHRQLEKKDFSLELAAHGLSKKRSLLDIFWERVAGRDLSFYYITKRFSQDGDLLSLKLYKIYEVRQISDFAETIRSVKDFLEETKMRNLLKDLSAFEAVCRKNGVKPYPVISALDSSRQKDKVDIYLSFKQGASN